MARFFKRRRPKLKPPRNRHDTLLVTHYGVLDIKEEYGSLRPRECTLISNNAIAGPPLIIEGLILGQRLNIGFAADDLEPSFWDQLQGAVRGRLEAAMCAAA
ncbi:MAG: hypothetical protein JO336_02150 [Acidobacteriia bacterium]|nr:hypothetical protein [Terriglobia bacterium]MBV8905745.1 hypothetical protein [Terriglobia bacterium]